jgi:hypothetical protein
MARFSFCSPPNVSGFRAQRTSRMTRPFAAFACAMALSLCTTDNAGASLGIRSDAPLFAALRADRTVRNCECLEAATWINQSYPRITVNPSAWKRLDARERRRFCESALRVAEATYLTEFAAADQYEVLYVYDLRGALLVTYRPR